MPSFSNLLLLLLGAFAISCQAKYYYSINSVNIELAPQYGWKYEGIVGYAFRFASGGENLVPFFQLRKARLDQYFFTRDLVEKQALLNSKEWREEGKFSVYGAPVTGSVPFEWLIKDKEGVHIWTADQNEVQAIRLPQGGGWRYEGTACWLPNQNTPNALPIYRFSA